MSTTTTTTTTTTTAIKFGPFEVTSQVFLTTPHSFALVNLKPLMPGHVLVCPLTAHRRLTDLTAPELTDLFTTVQRVQRMLARHYFQHDHPPPSSSPAATTTTTSASLLAAAGGSFNIAVQDGPEAGQTVAHVHVHVIPRARDADRREPPGADGGDGAHGGQGAAATAGDELYVRMAGEEGNVGGALWDRERPRPGGVFDRIEERERVARGMGEMEAEAGVYRRLLEEEKEGEDGEGKSV